MISHDKFIDKIKQYIDEKKLFSFGDHVIIGLSGGADSVCLLLVLKQQFMFITAYVVSQQSMILSFQDSFAKKKKLSLLKKNVMCRLLQRSII